MYWANESRSYDNSKSYYTNNLLFNRRIDNLNYKQHIENILLKIEIDFQQ